MSQLIILAGGKGTRLKSRLGDLPKPMIDVVGKPLIERQILLAKQYGFTDILILLGYGADAIRAFCGDGSKWNVNITYSEETTPLGTAGATFAAYELLADRFLVMYGDTMLNVDLSRFWQAHQTLGAEATLFLHPNDHPHDSDLVDVDQHQRITTFYPYPHDEHRYYPNLVNAALYVIEKKALQPWFQDKNIFDFGKDLFPAMLKAGQFLLGYRSPEYIKDIGTPARLDKVCYDFNRGKIAQGSLAVPSPVVFLDRDGTINVDSGHVKSVDEFILIPGCAAAIKNLNHSFYKTILITNQPVIARGDCDEAELKRIHDKLDTLLGKEGAFLDAMYYCPHHTDKGFPNERPELKFACDCRKPALGMLEQADKDFNIDFRNSWFVGDSYIDAQTAKNKGIRSIKVRTGRPEHKRKHAVQADFECHHLAEAIQFILKDFPQKMPLAAAFAKPIQAGELVLIGGVARSGKSTWASLLRYALEEKGLSAVVISLDGWLKNHEDRPKDSNVLGRHHVEAIEQLVVQLHQRDKDIDIQVPHYNRLLRQRFAEEANINITTKTVVIFEGVSALLIEKLNDLCHHRFYVDCSEVTMRARFEQEYQFRGLNADEVARLYADRLQNEIGLINQAKSNAIIIPEISSHDH
jgi:D,D-heptose 1,7-bisphosphate phosphatase